MAYVDSSYQSSYMNQTPQSHAGPSSQPLPPHTPTNQYRSHPYPSSDGPATTAHSTSSVPDVPGYTVDPSLAYSLREHVANLTGTRMDRFPGAQPVSFTKRSMDRLLSEDFWVCEKSDGQRVLVLVVVNANLGKQEVFLIDRKNVYKLQPNLFFPHHELSYYPRGSKEDKANAFRRARRDGIVMKEDYWPGRKDTLLDGELVWDTEKSTGQRRMRLLLFDALVVDGVNMSQRPLVKRYARLNQIFKPFSEYVNWSMQKNLPQPPFQVKVKRMDLSYGIEHVLARMPELEHGNDGLIFTKLNSGYVFGTDQNIIKWKPPSENSIDFMLRLRFPPDPRVPSGMVPDLRAKPFFFLEEYGGDESRNAGGGARYDLFDWLWIDDEEWEGMKSSGVQWDDRIVECVWEQGRGPPVSDDPTVPRPPGWRIMRIRDDKQDGNHCSIVRKIMGSIQDGVEENEVLEATGAIRSAWKTEERERIRKDIEAGGDGHQHQGQQHQQQHQQQQQHQPQPGGGGAASSTPNGAPIGNPFAGGPPRPMAVGPKGILRL